MDKLKRVLSGDDEDEERGIVAEVCLGYIYFCLKLVKSFIFVTFYFRSQYQQVILGLLF